MARDSVVLISCNRPIAIRSCPQRVTLHGCRKPRPGKGTSLGKEAVLGASGRAGEETARVGRVRRSDFFTILLENAGLFLEPAHILHDLIDILRRNAFDLRHVAELPMVGPDAVGRRQLEGLIPVMVWLVDLMH